jgi:hypothetical protein
MKKDNKHPSYGMLSISRVSGPKTSLFGSLITHSNTIVLRISTASERRNHNNTWYHTDNNIVEIEMSPTQFSEVITNINTQGVPVTIRKVQGEVIEPCPYVNMKELFEKEFQSDIRKVLSNTLKLMKQVEDKLLATGTLKKADRVEMAELLYHIEQDIRANMPFVQEQFNKQVDKATLQAKSELEAFFTSKIYSLGSKKLVEELEKKGFNNFLLEEK